MTITYLTALTTCLCCRAAIVIRTPGVSSRAAPTTIEHMPASLETEFALSALPAGLRQHASVYLLDPDKGHASA